MLELSAVKISDDGLKILFYYPLEQLRELDLSSTEVTVQGLELLPTGVQWTPSNPATLGTSQSALIRGVASFQWTPSNPATLGTSHTLGIEV